MIDENEITAERSPIYEGQYSERTVEKSLFNLFLSGEDDENLASIDDPKLYKSMIKGKIELTERLLESEKEKDVILSEKVAKLSQKEMNIKIDELSRSINESNQRISNEENERTYILKNIFHIDSHITHLRELVQRFSILNAHYLSDINRLEFMLEGEYLLSQLPSVPCPICGTTIDSIKIKNYLEQSNEKLIESMNHEKIKISIKREELLSTENDIKEELNYYLKSKSELQQSLSQLSILIENKLKPINKVLREDFEKFITLNQDIARLADTKEAVSRYEIELQEYKLKLAEKKMMKQIIEDYQKSTIKN
ncbi:MAG: hypothetical protein NHB15_11355 [Methanosarcina barkeri]|nr:hypothetical protein [Methanosarcina sp. ERenArc_MAG2]